MIEIHPTPEQKERARKLADHKPYPNSIYDGGGDLAAAMGEVVAADYFKAEHIPTKKYDLIMNGQTVEVKTKTAGVKPKPHYNGTVYVSSLHQTSRFLLFTRVMKDLSKAWICGFIRRANFLKQATFGLAGTDDGTGYKFPADCWNVPLSALSLPK